MTLRQGQAKEARLNGARLPSAESLRRELSTLVFTPDRLAVVKGGPAARRAYFDRVLARLFPARAGARRTTSPRSRSGTPRYGACSRGSRTAPRSSRGRNGSPTLGAALVDLRRAALETLAPAFAARADELGLPDARLGYDAGAPTSAALEARLAQDIDRGTTGLGPHLDDVLVASGDRDLRQFGSQGEQRLAVLSLLLAEAELLPTRRSCSSTTSSPSSTWVAGRCSPSAIAGMGQAMITATHASALPLEPAQIVEVEPGTAR